MSSAQDNSPANYSRGIDSLSIIRGIAGAIVGAIAGFFLFYLLIRIGLYGVALPGALAGMGGGWLSGRVSTSVGIACVVVAIVATVLSEWYVAPFIADSSLTFFVTHIHKTRTIFLVLGTIGIIMAFYFGRGRARFVSNRG